MSLTSLTTGISDYATRRAIQQLASKLNYDASPTFAGLTISGEALSSTLITQWSTAYSWGDHAGLYDTIGTASGEIDDHESTYDHSLLHSPVTLDALTGITLTGQQLSYTAGYAIPTTAKQAEWDSAYTHKTTEDAINGLVSCDGSGAYTAKVIGADVQAYDADLTAIAALTPADGNIIVGDGTSWVAESGDTARVSLGVGTTDSPTFAGLTATDGVAASKTTSIANRRAGQFILTFDASAGDVTYAFGCRNQITVSGAHNVTNNISGCSSVAQHDGTGTVAWARGAYGQIQSTGGGSITAGYALEASTPYIVGVGSAVVTACGLYVNAQSVTGVTTAYGIRQVGASDINNFVGKCKFGTDGTPAENVHASDTVRADIAFNLNGTDGVTQASSAGKVCDVTALAGGIATAQTQITYAADGTYNFDATSGKVSSITITNGRITAITTAA